MPVFRATRAESVLLLCRFGRFDLFAHGLPAFAIAFKLDSSGFMCVLPSLFPRAIAGFSPNKLAFDLPNFAKISIRIEYQAICFRPENDLLNQAPKKNDLPEPDCAMIAVCCAMSDGSTQNKSSSPWPPWRAAPLVQ